MSGPRSLQHIATSFKALLVGLFEEGVEKLELSVACLDNLIFSFEKSGESLVIRGVFFCVNWK